tara:strand:- start:1453 stop:1971 length:519 start_codon:yes stop_codon:yes gene_type:complete
MININQHLALNDSLYVSTIGENKMNTFEKIENAISTATVNGNFNSDLIEDKELRRLALLTYINKTVKQNPDSALREYQTADAYVYSEVAHYDHDQKEKTQKAVKLDSSTIILGGKIALVIEKSDSYILGKFDNPTFSDKPYFTIGYFDDSYFGGHYDLSLVDATNDFVNRNK